jgi:hypothetical protein
MPTPAPATNIEVPPDESASLTNDILNQIVQGAQLSLDFIGADGEPIGSVTLSESSAAQLIGDATGGGVAVSLTKAEPVDGRPVINFKVTDANDRPITQFGGPVTIAVPYTLLPDENSNAILVYYIASDGRLVPQRGHFDIKRSVVTFSVTHNSRFMVAHNLVTFMDVPDNHPHRDAIDFLAARGIINGIGNVLFAPEQKLTRVQFLVLLMRSYGVEIDETWNNNFDDVSGAWHEGWVATARRLGITSGVGNNRFEPDSQVTYEQMLLLTYNILAALGDGLPEAGVDAAISNEFSAWVYENYNWEKVLAAMDVITSLDNSFVPQNYIDRAMMAQILFELLTR